ncbi:MAG: protein-disulfide reductase DsbD domain-containing protein [Candidatus Aminicenantales bacterium]
MKPFGTRLFGLVFLFLSLVPWVFGQKQKSEPPGELHVRADLLAEVTSIQPGTEFSVAVRLQMDEGWHTYWRNPGDSGMPTKITWDLPPGFVAGKTMWPAPEKFQTSHLLSFGYTDEVFLLTAIKAPKSLKSGDRVRIAARVEWLECREECLPGQADVAVVLPVLEVPPALDDRWRQGFAETRKRLPQRRSGWAVRALADRTHIRIHVRFPSGSAGVRGSGVEFFPHTEGLVDLSEPQKVIAGRGEVTIRIKRSEGFRTLPPWLEGILVFPSGGDARESPWAFLVDVPLEHQVNSLEKEVGS